MINHDTQNHDGSNGIQSISNTNKQNYIGLNADLLKVNVLLLVTKEK